MPEKQYRLLDLFCGAGGDAVGLHQAMPNAEIIGIDIVPQPRFPFTFIQGDALNPPLDLSIFDFIWASPKCQGYSVTKTLHNHKHEKQIEQVRKLLIASGRPYIIENVVGAPLGNWIQLCGSAFGLGVRRHRRFESNIMLLSPGCRHDLQPEPIDVTGIGGPGGRHRKPRNLAEARSAMGIDWMTRYELTQAVPPAYAEYIGKQLLDYLKRG